MGRQVSLRLGRFRALLVAGLAAFQLSPVASSQEPGVPLVEVRIDAARSFQVMEGFGTSVRVFEDPHLTELADPRTRRNAVLLTRSQEDEILDRLYVDLGLTRIRPATDRGIEVENDNNDPARTDLRKFTWARIDAHVDFVKRARQRGANVFFLSPVSLESWMHADDVDEYCEWALTIVRHWRQMGLEMPFYSIANEPFQQANGPVSAEAMREIIKKLGRQFRADGLQTKFVITDDLGPKEASASSRVILADAAARSYVGALATHLYSGLDLSQMAALSSQYGLPLWMTEYYADDPWAYAGLMSDLITTHNVSAMDYMWGFFGEWDPPQTHLISLLYNSPKSKNYNHAEPSHYRGYVPNKIYYAVGQYSRFVKPGDRRVQTYSAPGIKVSAFRSTSSLTAVVVNVAGRQQRVRFEIADFSADPLAAATRTTDREDWIQLEPIPVDASSFAADVPGKSVTTFVLRQRSGF